jgi:lysozyme
MASRLKGVGAAAGVVTALGLLAITVVGNFEGLRLYAYQDVIGVWTACYGETKGIKGGMKFTKEQCDVMFIDGLARHEAGMRKCLTFPDLLPEKTYVAFLSFTYNVGTGGFCRSSIRYKANADDLRGACNALMKWTKAKGRTLKGLVTRRTQERKLCLQGVFEGVAS